MLGVVVAVRAAAMYSFAAVQVVVAVVCIAVVQVAAAVVWCIAAAQVAAAVYTQAPALVFRRCYKILRLR